MPDIVERLGGATQRNGTLVLPSSSPPEHYVDSPYLVPFDGSFVLEKDATEPKSYDGKQACKKALKHTRNEIADLQETLYAERQYALQGMVQAMDAAGKDGFIREVLKGVDPAGVKVISFKKPTEHELDHHFLHRIVHGEASRGEIGFFNRSHYEEVLIARVHTKILESQGIPELPDNLDQVFVDRYQSIVDYEAHLARNGIVPVKFFLHVAKTPVQAQRLLDRILEGDKNWKFNAGDMSERQLWDVYMEAAEEMIRYTSRPWAPWYVLPADKKPYSRMRGAEIIRDTLLDIDPQPPELDKATFKELGKFRKALEKELADHKDATS